MTKTCAVLAAVGLSVTVLIAQAPDARQALITRAKSLELNTPYVPPPGEPLEHYASGYAKIMCSAVFVTATPACAAGSRRRVTALTGSAVRAAVAAVRVAGSCDTASTAAVRVVAATARHA